MIWAPALFLLFAIAVAHTTGIVIYAIRTKIYQKKWNKEKSTRIRYNPQITRAELCEYFVMFCSRNDCKVKF